MEHMNLPPLLKRITPLKHDRLRNRKSNELGAALNRSRTA